MLVPAERTIAQNEDGLVGGRGRPHNAAKSWPQISEPGGRVVGQDIGGGRREGGGAGV